MFRYLVHFPAYTKDTALKVLGLDCPRAVDQGFYRSFCTLLWDVFHGACRDLNELRHLVALLFPIYYSPLPQPKGDGKIGAALSRAKTVELYEHILPHLRTQLNKLYLRETSSVEWSATHSPEQVSWQDELLRVYAVLVSCPYIRITLGQCIQWTTQGH